MWFEPVPNQNQTNRTGSIGSVLVLVLVLVLASLSGSGSGSDKMGAELNQTEVRHPYVYLSFSFIVLTCFIPMD